MYSGILDLRGQAKYDEVLEILLPEEKKDDIQRYRETVFRYRRKYWDGKEGEGQMMGVLKKTATLDHEKQIAENAMGDIKKKASNPKQSAMEVQRPMIQDSNKKIQAIGEAVAFGTGVNKTQKRVLSDASLHDQDHKRRRQDNEDALFELSEMLMSEDEEGKSE